MPPSSFLKFIHILFHNSLSLLFNGSITLHLSILLHILPWRHPILFEECLAEGCVRIETRTLCNALEGPVLMVVHQTLSVCQSHPAHEAIKICSALVVHKARHVCAVSAKLFGQLVESDRWVEVEWFGFHLCLNKFLCYQICVVIHGCKGIIFLQNLYVLRAQKYVLRAQIAIFHAVGGGKPTV